jgi:hypothetical protein
MALNLSLLSYLLYGRKKDLPKKDFHGPPFLFVYFETKSMGGAGISPRMEKG